MKKIKYLQRIKTSEGEIIYFRKGGKTIARLPAIGSPEFRSAYNELLAQHCGGKKPGRPFVKRPAGSSGSGRPTVDHFARLYLASDDFADLAEGTRRNYEAAIELMHDKGIRDEPLSYFTPRTAELYIQRVKREHGGATALMQKVVLSNLWTFARGFPEFDAGDRTNPLKSEITMPYQVRQEHLPWPEQVQDAFLSACDADMRLAFHLLLYTGQRISDVVKMTWEQYVVRDGSTYIALAHGQQKDRKKTPMMVRVPKVLQREIDRHRGNHATILTQDGEPFTRLGLTQRIKRLLKKIGEPIYTTHGLRKNAGITLAENGATVQQIMAALGHKTPRMALYYIRLANQRLLSDQAAEIMDLAAERREETRKTAKRANLKVVK